ncbi:5-formyltetrahydrofolate cyclo-ligase [Microbacterium lushaniae]|nr:5-formyltetrahydrofolate cyclo-ligase [Microbacterium lushaniae]KAA9148487.1 5-formyltetrahydrofolate cyclo-ligase [Microbacterium lushaniae]
MTSAASHDAELWTGRHEGKDRLRERVWAALLEAGAVATDPRGSIPDFDGADRAAAKLAELEVWHSARVVKCTPDACQQPIRLRALEEGKTLYMAYPRLAVYPCFLRLTRADLDARGVSLEEASTMDGAIKWGHPIPFEEMEHIDLVNVGSVAATGKGARTGKGAGFADLELGLLREYGKVDEATAVATTIHPLSLVDDDAISIEPTDSPLDWVVTEEQVIETHTPLAAPAGIDWDRIQPDQLVTIPILGQLARERGITT